LEIKPLNYTAEQKELILVMKEPSDKSSSLYPIIIDHISYNNIKLNNLIKVRTYNLIGRLSIKNRTLCELEKAILKKKGGIILRRL